MEDTQEIEPLDIVEATNDLPLIVGAPAQAPKPAPKALPRLGPYRLLAKFNSGMSLVFLGYRVTSLGTRQNAVIKLASRKHSDFTNLHEMLIDEARAMSTLDHPNVVRVLETLEGEYGFAVALEYVPGVDAASLLAHCEATQTRLSPALSAFVLTEMLRGLDHAHEATAPDGAPLGIVHRDVTPSNVLISRTGHVKLTDFGVVHMSLRLQKPTAPGFVKGKLSYLAPEYVNGGALDRRSDLYSAGVMLFELLIGDRTLKKNEMNLELLRNLMAHGLPMKKLLSVGTPRPLVEVVMTATAREPADRYSSAREMSEALERWLRENREFIGASDLERCVATAKR